MLTRAAVALLLPIALATSAAAQEPAAWHRGADLTFHTFSIVAVDPATGETGVIVTTRNPCVGNAVPWVRAGVGAVATQGGTRVEYGNDLLDLLAKGVDPQTAMDQVVAADNGRESRQVGVIDSKGRSAQWTGKGQYGAEKQGDWVHMRTGATFAVQGNSLVSTRVVDVVADTFQASEGSIRALADRLIEALDAGHRLGGDGRHGETQSAAVLVADPRPGMSRRPDGVTVNINVCEHPEPVGELRRIYDTSTETLGFRTLEQFIGRDVVTLKLMLHALGYYRPDAKEIPLTGGDALVYTEEAVKALDAFRAAQEWGTTVPGFVDRRVIDRLWQRLKEKNLDEGIRRTLLTIYRLR
ncbi:MAG: DUF1028 domain-containing protein [Acidobacteria bacterium]|nr:DUF1028 domain-containing protein [Acidobacteriota bacterium]